VTLGRPLLEDADAGKVTAIKAAVGAARAFAASLASCRLVFRTVPRIKAELTQRELRRARPINGNEHAHGAHAIHLLLLK
jgi:hypothetical protein